MMSDSGLYTTVMMLVKEILLTVYQLLLI